MITASDMGKKSWEVRQKKYGNKIMKEMSKRAAEKRTADALKRKNEANLVLDTEG